MRNFILQLLHFFFFFIKNKQIMAKLYVSGQMASHLALEHFGIQRGSYLNQWLQDSSFQ